MLKLLKWMKHRTLTYLLYGDGDISTKADHLLALPKVTIVRAFNFPLEMPPLLQLMGGIINKPLLRVDSKVSIVMELWSWVEWKINLQKESQVMFVQLTGWS